MDRLTELQKMNDKRVVYKEQIQQDDGQIFPEFQGKIQQAKGILKQISFNNEQVEQLKSKYSKATTGEKEILRELDGIILEDTKLNNRLKDIMNSISKDVEISKSKDPNGFETKNKQTIQQSLQNHVNEVLQKEQTVQTSFKVGLKDKLARQTRYLDSNLTEEQIDELSNDPQKAQELFQKKLYGTASLQLQNTISDMQDKYRDIEKLEKSVQQVYQLFVDLAMLVQQQGEMIDVIEVNIQSAYTDVRKGEKNLQQAKEHHQVTRKRMCCILIIGLVIILVIVLPITLKK